MSSEESAIHIHSALRPPQSAISPQSAPRQARGALSPSKGAIHNPHSRLRPLLKWAGGKRQLLPALRAFFPAEFGRYFEPFVGSGAVFFDLAASGRLDGHRAWLSDCNDDLIGCYSVVREDPEAVIRQLERLADAHARDPAGHFYAARDRFNAMRDTDDGRPVWYTPRLAATLIYLNRTGFNGLFRLNRAGRFNVPAGRYDRPRISDPALVRAVAGALGRPGVRLTHERFEQAARRARAGDFLYFDPPYVPLTATASFTGYTGQPFTLDDHRRLRDAAVDLARRGCHVIVSNSSAPVVAALYQEASARTGGAPARPRGPRAPGHQLASQLPRPGDGAAAHEPGAQEPGNGEPVDGVSV